jgi:quinol monooxygenase YgiN
MLADDATPLKSEALMLHVLAVTTTKPGMRDAVLPTLGPFQAELGLDTFVVVEKWASTEALNAMPHLPI